MRTPQYTPSASACRCAIGGASASAPGAAFPSETAAGASAPRAWSHAASSARRTTAPTSGDSRPRTTTIPSSSTHVRSDRVSCRRRSSDCSASRSTRRHARTIFSTWAAVPDSATFSRSSSVSGVATRVTARIFE